MSNIYYEHLETLRSIKIQNSPAISMYIPLRWSDYSPGKIFSALVKAANSLLIKSGNPTPDISAPEWERWTKQGTITLAIFYHEGVTTIIPIPTRMQPRVVVAKSFHIKPILTAANECFDSLLLHFNEAGASLYRINHAGETLIDSYIHTKGMPDGDWPIKMNKYSLEEFLEFLKLEIKGSILPTTKMIGITGTSFREFRSESFWKNSKLPIVFLDESFRASIPHNAFSILRLRLAQIVNEKNLNFVKEVLVSTSQLQENLSLNTLGQKILGKQITQLCVSLEDMHFGELDMKTGEVTINKTQRDSSDDDLFDDLVELAIDNGIKVSVVPKKYLPNGRNFIAS